MYVWLITKSVLIQQNWLTDNCSSVFLQPFCVVFAFTIPFLTMEEYHTCIQPKKHICLQCITNTLMFKNVK